MNLGWILNLNGIWVHILSFHFASYLTIYLTRYWKQGTFVWLLAWVCLPVVEECIPIGGHTFSLVDIVYNYIGVLLSLVIIYYNRRFNVGG